MNHGVYYNDSEPFVCDWLENLIRAKLLPDGIVDRRRIEEVRPEDVQGFAQCHFFAGIGGWAYALQLAGWGDRPVWTGSCPCQPFSVAGEQRGHDDDRHLWPSWFSLIRQCHPRTVFGEQVSNATGLGWLDAVAMDMETIDYAIGACVLGAHSVGAPHRRHRLYFVADPNLWWLEGRRGVATPSESRQGRGGVSINGPSLQCLEVDPLVGEAVDATTTWATEPHDIRVAHGIPARVGRLRAYGNAIVPQVAAAFVKSYLECVG